ncbi:TRAFAC clade GTPase domain-containing protein [Acinetobacter albensis]|uniref:Double-GTPase 1 domain-containing protein n=1 Tax=Acinetobacter albensis TaxID=1673609 RepID=A0A1C4GRW5_9GAMM|nr:hypothetical protein [Acinetobacter albensis]SCC70919.1 hypothetical protein GA0116959_1025 [Acinetobacter albensis]
MYNFLILGEPAAGKSNFLRMLAYNWSLKNSSVIQTKTPSKLLSQDILQGYVVDRTQESYKNFEWCLKYQDKVINIELPEYNGEEFLALAQSPEWSKEWVERIEDCNGIILVISADKDEVYDLARPAESQVETQKNDKTGKDNLINNDLNYIAFFQQLFCLKQISRKTKKKIPLLIVMNFWDKVIKDKIDINPEQKLKNELPWFYEFIKTNWDTEYLKIFGISPLGDHAENLYVKSKYPDKPLKKVSDAKGKFVKSLPTQSWVVNNDNPQEKIRNLSLPFMWLFEKVGS